MKWTLLRSLGIGGALMLATASGLRLLGQQPLGNSHNGNGTHADIRPSVPMSQQQYTNPQQTHNSNQNASPGFFSNTSNSYHLPNQQREEGRQALREAQSKLRAADSSESDKKEARAAIEKFLGDEFERDQKMRRDQVERLEEQISKLRKQLDKREQSKTKIIDLRMQLMENDAEGLSFPESFHELQRFEGAPGSIPNNVQYGGPHVPYSGQGTNGFNMPPVLTDPEFSYLLNRVPNLSPNPLNINRPPENNQGKTTPNRN